MALVHLIVDKGHDAGKQVSVPAEGARMGRSSKNDVVLVDPMLSRHHCRLFFKTDDGLWVSDLGSSNDTLVNGNAIQEQRLKVGDIISIGSTDLRVVHASLSATPAVAGDATVDLGLEKDVTASGRKLSRGTLIGVAAVVVLLAVLAWLPRLLPEGTPEVDVAVPLEQPEKLIPEINYEKVEATSTNIFRYHLTLSADLMLAVQIDDIVNDRHVRKEKKVDPDYAENLGQSIMNSGFFGLMDAYEGVQPGIHDQWDLSVTIGQRTHRTRVTNRVEPDAFRNVRELVEECGKNELGLWAIQFSPAKLRSLAEESYLLGRKLYDEREVRHENLFKCIASFSEADWYLETVEPKPEYYGTMMSSIREAKDELQQRYQDQNFRAERSIRLREWDKAAAELRTILEMIPDRSDERHQEARKKLLDVGNRLQEL